MRRREKEAAGGRSLSRRKGMKSSAHTERGAVHRVADSWFTALGKTALNTDRVVGKRAGVTVRACGSSLLIAPIFSVK